jgi:hypothetical protein
MSEITSLKEAAGIVGEYARRVAKNLPLKQEELVVILDAVNMLKPSMNKTIVAQDVAARIAGGIGKGAAGHQALALFVHENVMAEEAARITLASVANRAAFPILHGPPPTPPIPIPAPIPTAELCQEGGKVDNSAAEPVVEPPVDPAAPIVTPPDTESVA